MADSTCQKCGKTMDEKNFYTYKDGRKTELCKKCLTMHIDNFNPETFLWALEMIDVPYLPEEWNVLRDKAYAKDPFGMNGMSVFGKYLSKMKLKQWKEYGWADTERLQALNAEKREAAAAATKEFEAEIRQQYENGEISEAKYKTLMSTETQNEEMAYKAPRDAVATGGFYNEQNFISEGELVDPANELTAEDKIMLAMKWGRLYKPSEWVELEKKYQEMMKSFDIQDSDTEGTLLVICKIYLKMNQAIDCGDLDGFQKLSRTYESLRKSAKFTAVQNKEQNNNFLDSVGELVAYCEREGGAIPKFIIEEPLDKVDKIIEDLKEYNKTLIYSDTTLSAQIEDYLKQRRQMDEAREEKRKNGGKLKDVTDEDYMKHLSNIEEDLEHDKEVYEEE